MERQNQKKGAKTGLGSGASAGARRTNKGTVPPGTPPSYTVLRKATQAPVQSAWESAVSRLESGHGKEHTGFNHRAS